MSALVAIVGRPNVGKSTLFNRLIGKRRAIESNISGTTRDRIYASTKIDDYNVILVDTGGLDSSHKGDDIEDNIQEQSKIAINTADVILFVVDVRSDLTSDDFHAANLLRKSKKSVILIANKCDNPSIEEHRFNLYELGFGEPVAVTAIHSYGFDEIENRVVKELKKIDFKKAVNVEESNESIKIAFVGRPNVGKSTMVNAIFGDKVVITSDIPGTTRDSTEIPFKYNDENFILVDTAGLRRRGDIEKGIEEFSVLRALQAIEQADICVLMLDFEEGLTNQDCHVSEYILEQNKGLILVVNKIDKLKGEDRDDAENFYIHTLKSKMAYVPWAPVVFTSAIEKKFIYKILDLASSIYNERRRTVLAQDLNIWLDSAIKKHPPNSSRGKHKFAIKQVMQINTNPPEFLFNCNWPEVMHFSYGRYLENDLRDKFGFGGTALKLIFKKEGDALSRKKFKRKS